MRALLFVIVLLAIALGLSPLLTGVMFKKVYMQQVAYYQQQLAKSNVKLEVVDYKSGWFHSTARLRLTDLNKSDSTTLIPQVTSEVDSYIDHGPLVRNPKTGSLTLGYADVNTNVHLPAFIEGFLRDKTKGALQIKSLVKFNGKTWLNHYEIPAVVLGNNFKWDGLKGDATVYYSENEPMDIDATFTIGATSLNPPATMAKIPQASTQPITISVQAAQQPLNLWNGTSSLMTDGAKINWQNGNAISIGRLEIDGKYGLNDEKTLYNYNVDSTLASLVLPSALPINNISNLKHSFYLNGLDANGLSNFQKQYKQLSHEGNDLNQNERKELLDALLKVLSPSTTLDWSIVTDTNLGSATGNAKVSFTNGVPQTPEELQTKLNISINASAALNLVDTLVGLAPPPKDTTKPTLRQQIDLWVQQGYIIKNDKNYSIVFIKQGTTYTVNGKDISAEVAEAMQKAPATEPGPVVPAPTSTPSQSIQSTPANVTPPVAPVNPPVAPATEPAAPTANPNQQPNTGMVTQPVQ